MMGNVKSFLLLSFLTIILVLAGSWLGGMQGAVIAFFLAFLMNIIAYWFSDKIILKRYRAREVREADDSSLYQMVQELATRAGMPMPKVYLIPDKTPNAFATGRNPSHAAVAATEGILDLLSRDELEGVMAHELAHVKHRDTLTGTVAATLAGAITLIAQMGRYSASSRNRNPLAILGLVLLPLAALIIRMAISRVREYAADKGGAEICGKPVSLANALNKLSRGSSAIPISRGNPSDSHLFIVHPFKGGLQNLLSTHPPMEKRIDRLVNMT